MKSDEFLFGIFPSKNALLIRSVFSSLIFNFLNKSFTSKIILFLIPSIFDTELSILRTALIHGFFNVNTFVFIEFCKTFEIKGTIILSFPASYAFKIKSRKSKSFAKIGLFLERVNFPSQLPKHLINFLSLISSNF